MANNNSQNPKDSKKNTFSKIFSNPRHSVSPVPSERSQGRSSKNPWWKFARSKSTSPSQTTLSFPLTPSTENPGGEIPLGKYCIFSMYILNCNLIVDPSTVTVPDGIPPNRSSLTMDSSQYPDRRTTSASSGSHALATSPAIQGERPYDPAPYQTDRRPQIWTIFLQLRLSLLVSLLVRTRLHLTAIGGLHPIIFSSDSRWSDLTTQRPLSD
jgi:hypothetical protein